MLDLVLVFGVVVSAFVATNLDNLVLLVALFSRYSDRQLEVALGYLLSMILIGSLAWAVGTLATSVSVQYLGFLGIVPVAIGIVGVVRLFRRRGVVSDPAIAGAGSTAMLAAALTQLSNGTDTIVTFSILFADSNEVADHLVIVSFVVMAAVFAIAARHAQQHPWLSRPIQLYGHYITPLILITVGLYVLNNTGMDMLPGN